MGPAIAGGGGAVDLPEQVKFYQTGKGEEEVIHAGNEDLQFELVWIQSHPGSKMCHLQSSFSQLQTRCECPGKQRFKA